MAHVVIILKALATLESRCICRFTNSISLEYISFPATSKCPFLYSQPDSRRQLPRGNHRIACAQQLYTSILRALTHIHTHTHTTAACTRTWSSRGNAPFFAHCVGWFEFSARAGMRSLRDRISELRVQVDKFNWFAERGRPRGCRGEPRATNYVNVSKAPLLQIARYDFGSRG